MTLFPWKSDCSLLTTQRSEVAAREIGRVRVYCGVVISGPSRLLTNTASGQHRATEVLSRLASPMFGDSLDTGMIQNAESSKIYFSFSIGQRYLFDRDNFPMRDIVTFGLPRRLVRRVSLFVVLWQQAQNMSESFFSLQCCLNITFPSFHGG